MHYNFPKIENIDDVIRVVEDRDEFSVIEKDDHTIICYNLMTPNTFPPIMGEDEAILRECRGITFCNDTGKVIARKFHKFFNLGEREETLHENVDFSKPHVILEKLDGSMITPVIHSETLRWHTKRGLSDVAMRAEVFVAQNLKYKHYALFCLSKGFTPIFEWCSRKDKIVLDYNEDRLDLLAVRHMETGKYEDDEELLIVANQFDIPVVRQYNPDDLSTEDLIKVVGEEDDMEGIVIRFSDGHMLKVKSEWYCNLHRVLSNFVWEYNVVRVILDDKTDDLKAVLKEHGHPMADTLKDYEEEFWKCFVRIVEQATKKYLRLIEEHDDRKGIATSEYMTKKATPLIKMLIFKKLDGKDMGAVLKDHLLRTVTRNSSWERIKSQCIFGELQWKCRGSE